MKRRCEDEKREQDQANAKWHRKPAISRRHLLTDAGVGIAGSFIGGELLFCAPSQPRSEQPWMPVQTYGSEPKGRGTVSAMSIVDRLWDMEQIKQLKARYFRFLDTKQWKEFRSIFADDFKWFETQGDGTEVKYASPEAFIKWQAASHDDDRVVSVHQGHMPEIELTSNRTARGIWAMFDWVDHPTKQAFQGFGHYYEEYEKGSDGKWRIQSIRLVRLRVDEVPPAHEMNKEYPRGLAPWWPHRPDGESR